MSCHASIFKWFSLAPGYHSPVPARSGPSPPQQAGTSPWTPRALQPETPGPACLPWALALGHIGPWPSPPVGRYQLRNTLDPSASHSGIQPHSPVGLHKLWNTPNPAASDVWNQPAHQQAYTRTPGRTTSHPVLPTSGLALEREGPNQ